MGLFGKAKEAANTAQDAVSGTGLVGKAKQAAGSAQDAASGTASEVQRRRRCHTLLSNCIRLCA